MLHLMNHDHSPDHQKKNVPAPKGSARERILKAQAKLPVLREETPRKGNNKRKKSAVCMLDDDEKGNFNKENNRKQVASRIKRPANKPKPLPLQTLRHDAGKVITPPRSVIRQANSLGSSGKKVAFDFSESVSEADRIGKKDYSSDNSTTDGAASDSEDDEAPCKKSQSGFVIRKASSTRQKAKNTPIYQDCSSSDSEEEKEEDNETEDDHESEEEDGCGELTSQTSEESDRAGKSVFDF